MATSAIQNFKECGCDLHIEGNSLVFVDSINCRYVFDLEKKEFRTNVFYSSESKKITKIIEKFKKELGWL